jgi:GNAT superfamily N-acetyltransferase
MNESAEVFVIKKPSDCSEAELQDFAALILAGGEVTAVGLNTRIKKAEALVFLSQSDCLKGIAAVKNPEQNYKSDVFQKAKASVQANEFTFELGWVFVLPSSRGAGFSHKFVQARLGATDGRAIFATLRSDNTPMHKVLNANGLSKNGGEYASIRGNQNLVLFVSNVAQQGALEGRAASGTSLS